MHIRELFLRTARNAALAREADEAWFSWTNFFLGIDWVLKKIERWRLTPLRRRAVRKAVAWMRERLTRPKATASARSSRR